MKSVYIICQYNGYEGHGAPIQAADTLDAGKALLRAMKAGAFGSEIRLYEVPIWPDVDGETYRKPIEDKPCRP